MPATKEAVSRFFDGVEGDQDAGAIELIPTGKKSGIPGNLHLFEVEDDTEVRHSGDNAKTPGHPFVNTRNVILEPEDYVDRVIFGMFYFPAEVDEDAVAEIAIRDKKNVDKAIKAAHESYENQRKRFVGTVDGILGEGACAALAGDTLEEIMEELAEQLKGMTFVGTLGKEKGKDGYDDKNKIMHYAAAETWGQEEE